MDQAIGAYRSITASPEFQEIERLREKARHDEAQALYNAKKEEREKWQGVVAEKETENENLRKKLSELQERLEN